MTDEQRNTEATEQVPPVRIGEDLDIDLKSAESYRRDKSCPPDRVSGGRSIHRSKVSLSVSHDNLTFDKLTF